MKKQITSILGFLVIWEVVGTVADPIFFVSFSDAIIALIKLFTEKNLHLDVMASFQRIIYALTITFSIAIPLGIAIASSKSSEQVTRPITKFLRFVPAPTLIPLSVVWFGIGEFSKVFIITWGIFFTVLLSVRDATENVPKEFTQIAKSMGYSNFKRLQKIILPAISPDILNTLRIAIVESWIYLLIAEMIAAKQGVGKSLILAQRFLQVDNIFAILILLAIIGIATDVILVKTRNYLFKYKY